MSARSSIILCVLYSFVFFDTDTRVDFTLSKSELGAENFYTHCTPQHSTATSNLRLVLQMREVEFIRLAIRDRGGRDMRYKFPLNFLMEMKISSGI